MMNQKLLDALETCLQRMQHGEPLEYVLASYPELAAELRPLLETAVQARSARRESLAQATLAKHRSQGLALAADLRRGDKFWLTQRRSLRPAVRILAVIAILVMSSNGLLVASAHSIPGDPLYALKLKVESTQLQLASGPAERQILEQTFSERRMDETRSLITIHRIATVEFSGVVSSQSDGEWLVSGIPVVISARTNMDEGIEIGEDIDVQGSTDATGNVDAARLTLDNDSDADNGVPVMSPTHTPSTEGSEGPGLTATPVEPSVTPAHSSDNSDQTADRKDQTPMKADENHSSPETTHTPRPDSESSDN
jgi:hypothetical protein